MRGMLKEIRMLLDVQPLESVVYAQMDRDSANSVQKIRLRRRRNLNLLSEKDYKALQGALEAKLELTLTRTLGDYKITAEVTTAPKVWGIPMLIQVKQWHMNIYRVKNCATVAEMREYISEAKEVFRYGHT